MRWRLGLTACLPPRFTARALHCPVAVHGVGLSGNRQGVLVPAGILHPRRLYIWGPQAHVSCCCTADAHIHLSRPNPLQLYHRRGCVHRLCGRHALLHCGRRRRHQPVPHLCECVLPNAQPCSLLRTSQPCGCSSCPSCCFSWAAGCGLQRERAPASCPPPLGVARLAASAAPEAASPVHAACCCAQHMHSMCGCPHSRSVPHPLAAASSAPALPPSNTHRRSSLCPGTTTSTATAAACATCCSTLPPWTSRPSERLSKTERRKLCTQSSSAPPSGHRDCRPPLRSRCRMSWQRQGWSEGGPGVWRPCHLLSSRQEHMLTFAHTCTQKPDPAH